MESLTTIAPREIFQINLSPESKVFFSKCEAATANYTSLKVNSDKPNEALQLILTDGDVHASVYGKVMFDVLENTSSLINNPGPDLRIIEIAGAEPLNITAFDPGTGTNKSMLVRTTPTGNITSCNVNINEAQIDYSNFGIGNGSALSSLRVDNLGSAIHTDDVGTEDELRGADIAEVSSIEPSLRAEVTSPAPGNITGKSPFCIAYNICFG
ncbi:MAG: hypothetical protein ACRD5J_20585, partial [Nitrososphaeraceae archaeon]